MVALLAAGTIAAPAGANVKHQLKPMKILVSNDDGVKAEGIDRLVAALRKERRVGVTIVAPATNQSGSGGRYSVGTLKASKTTTLGGFGARAVRGFPADTIRYAYETLFKTRASRPDLVISGANAGTNLGSAIDNSGTIGAARAGAAHGIPALAVSQGLAQGSHDYSESVRQAVLWLRANRSRLKRLRGMVFNLNSPAGGVSTIARIPARPAIAPAGTPAAP